MKFPENFICAGRAYSDIEHPVSAPYLRKSFELDNIPEKAELLICGLGFYELTVNGVRVTRGHLAPYVSNPDHMVYYDGYDLLPYLRVGENVLGVCLGNGFQNNYGGTLWRFDKARWRGAPQMALQLVLTGADGAVRIIESDETFRTAPSPTLSDDRILGETYDAGKEIPGWDCPGFDDSEWKPAEIAPQPRGQRALNRVVPIEVIRELPALSVIPCGEGYIYDFGEISAGVCCLKVKGEPGQRIELVYGEFLRDGRIDNSDIIHPGFGESMYTDVFICSGGEDEWSPQFSYRGCRYVMAKGLKPEQASKELLTFRVMYSNLRDRADFACSDERANWLYRIALNSLHTNFCHYPTDCPQREKNGWTGDAAVSADVMTMLMDVDDNFHQWMENIRKAQSDRGSLPGIVPTQHEWGYGWWHGPGPCWDSVLVNIPFALYRDRHDTEIIRENAHAVWRYLDHISEALELTGDGLIRYGLGDWCHVGRPAERAKCPQGFADTVIAMDICAKAELFFEVLDKPEHRAFAHSLYERIRSNARERLLDRNTMTALGSCQTSQAMAIDYGLFDPAEKPAAFRRLLELIHEQDDHMDVGIFGAKSLFHVLSDFGETELAYRMMLRPDYPSFGYLIERGATAIPENLYLKESDSLNHQMWSDVARWLIRAVAGIRYNPRLKSGLDRRKRERVSDVEGKPCKPCIPGAEADICPAFIPGMDYAEGSYDAPEGRIRVRWERSEDGILLKISVPEVLFGHVILPKGWIFEDTENAIRQLNSGDYKVRKIARGQ